MERPLVYPEFTYSGDMELELPDEGEMTITFRKVRESEEKRNGKDWYSCTVEVCSIEGYSGDEDPSPPTKSGSEAETALDNLARKLVSLHNDLEKTD